MMNEEETIILKYLDKEGVDIVSFQRGEMRVKHKDSGRKGNLIQRCKEILPVIEISWDGEENKEYFIKRQNPYLYFFIGTSKEISDKNLLLVSLVDGLGNQMCQYAFGVFLSKLGKNVKVDPRWYRQSNSYRKELLSSFELLNSVPFCSKTESSIFKSIKEEGNKDKFNYDTDWKKFNYELNLFGYWQDYRYVKDNEKDLQIAFKLKHSLNDENLKILDKILNTNSVMIHVRRGDYFKYPERYSILDKDYYLKAISIIKDKVDNPYFFCFGEDQEWIKNNLLLNNDEYTCISNNLSKEEDCVFDLELMKNCKHQIIANSTFSWWSAILNENKEKIIISPANWGDSFVKTINNEEWITI